MKYTKEQMIDMLNDYPESDFLVVEDKITEHGRWHVLHSVVFRDKTSGKFYSAYYRVGATESQEVSPWEYDGPEIEVDEVHQVEKTIKVWEKIS